MVNNLKQYYYNANNHAQLEMNLVLINRARRVGKVKAVLMREAIDKFIEKYDPQDPEKISQWMPPERRKFYRLCSIYLTSVQSSSLEEIANQRSQSLNREILPGDAIMSAAAEYLGRVEFR